MWLLVDAFCLNKELALVYHTGRDRGRGWFTVRLMVLTVCYRSRSFIVFMTEMTIVLLSSFCDVLCCIYINLFSVFIEFSLVISLDSNNVISCACYVV